MKGNANLPDQFQTYIDHAWQAHAAKLEELNAAIGVREWVNGIIAQHETELQALAEQASEALPWGPGVEGASRV